MCVVSDVVDRHPTFSMLVSCRSAPLNFQDLANSGSTQSMVPKGTVPAMVKEGTSGLERVKRLAVWDRPASGEAKRADLNGSGVCAVTGGSW